MIPVYVTLEQLEVIHHDLILEVLSHEEETELYGDNGGAEVQEIRLAALEVIEEALTQRPPVGSSPMFLTLEELVELTHAKRRDTQIRALRSMGIEHRVRPDGTVAILRTHIEQVFGLVPVLAPVPG